MKVEHDTESDDEVCAVAVGITKVSESGAPMQSLTVVYYLDHGMRLLTDYHLTHGGGRGHGRYSRPLTSFNCHTYRTARMVRWKT